MLVVGVLAVLVVVGAAGIAVATASAAAGRAASAADLAALAGAMALRDDGSVESACGAAARVAARNGATLVGCRDGPDYSITVSCRVPTNLVGPQLPSSVERSSRAGPSSADE